MIPEFVRVDEVNGVVTAMAYSFLAYGASPSLAEVIPSAGGNRHLVTFIIQ